MVLAALLQGEGKGKDHRKGSNKGWVKQGRGGEGKGKSRFGGGKGKGRFPNYEGGHAIPLANGSRISDLTMSRDPESGTAYLAVMVDLSLDWPTEVERDSIESMSVNE